jgi:hypothetical protein
MTASTDAPQPRRPGIVRRFIIYLRDRWYGAPQTLPIYDFKDVTALKDGWQTHVARQLAIHEQSARRAQSLHYSLGILAAVFASLAGSSAVVAWQTQTSNNLLAILSAVIACGASVFTGVVTFLGLGGRAERHRKAAADYKSVLRELEAFSFEPAPAGQPLTQQSDVFKQLQTTLRDIDASAPIPPRRIAERVYRRKVKPRSSVFASCQDQDPRSNHEG